MNFPSRTRVEIASIVRAVGSAAMRSAGIANGPKNTIRLREDSAHGDAAEDVERLDRSRTGSSANSADGKPPPGVR